MMSAIELAETLRKRVSEFGEKPSYILFPEELLAGQELGLFVPYEPQDRGDGTLITTVIFEQKTFTCATEK